MSRFFCALISMGIETKRGLQPQPSLVYVESF